VTRRAGRRQAAALPLLSIIGLAGCGSGTSTTATGSGSLPPTTPAVTSTSTTTTATSTATAQPTHVLWVTQGAGAQQIRAVDLSGAGAHTVASIPADAVVLGAGRARVAVAWSDHTIHMIDIASGVSTTYDGGGDQLFGGAFSPDDSQFAYVVVTSSPLGGSLRVVALASHSVTTLRTFSGNPLDVPTVWASDAFAGTAIVAFADAGPQAAVRMDPHNGNRLAVSNTAGSTGPHFSRDALHAGDAIHSALGDDADAAPGPGPQGPFNTLRTFTVGSAPTSVLQEAHHNIGIIAVSDDGTAIAWYDDSAAGGFAGISLNDNFGLLLLHSGVKTNLHHLDGRFDAGVFTHDQSLVVAKHSGSAEMLQLFANGHDGVTIDSVTPASGAGQVALF
jgi:hypothetical protein